MSPPDWINKRVGKYELLEYLGGGMSDVYRARDTGVLGKTVAVKILTAEKSVDAEAKQRFLREAQIAGNIHSHPNILSVYDYGVEAERPYMVMEFLHGVDLRTAIKQKGAGDLVNKLRIAQQVASALEHIHRQTPPIIHRDVKPDNIYIDAAGIVKLIDFGIAKTEGLDITNRGYAVGTLYYMAPEQVLGKDVTPLVDVYGFGILLFELITGSKPFTGASYEEVFSRIINQPLDLAPLRALGIPEELTGLIASCAAKNASQRPQSFGKIGPQLKKIIESLERPHSPPHRIPGWAKMAVLGTVVILVVAFALEFGLVSEPVPDEPVVVTAPPSVEPLPDIMQTTSGEMVLIPAGDFLSGPEKQPVTLPAFYINRTEVTNEAYGKFCHEQNSCPPGFEMAQPDHPVVNITIGEAQQFARWAGQRLPTPGEWEKAARGLDGRPFPWGDDSAAENVANIYWEPPENSPKPVSKAASRNLAPANAFPDGDSSWGVRQLVGNVWEFIDQTGTPGEKALEKFRKLMAASPPKDGELWYAVAGGSYKEDLFELPSIAYDQAFVPARFRGEDIGFRCVQDLE